MHCDTSPSLQVGKYEYKIEQLNDYLLSRWPGGTSKPSTEDSRRSEGFQGGRHGLGEGRVYCEQWTIAYYLSENLDIELI